MNYLKLIENRLSEIKDMISCADIDNALKLFLDFSREFSTDNEIRKYAIELSYKYRKTEINLRKNIISYVEAETVFDKTITEILDYSDKIYQCGKENYISNKKSYIEKKDNEIILNCSSLANFFLKNININIKKSEIIGVTGENASGKTTLCKIIAGNLKYSKGELNYPIWSKKNKIKWSDIKQKVVFLKQSVTISSGYLTLKEFLHFQCALYGLKGKKNLEEVNYIIQRFNLTEFADKTSKILSGGYRLRFSLAVLIVRHPKFLILDEPLANLDYKMQLTLLQDLKNISRNHINPLTILITSQHIFEIEAISDRILFLKNGKIVYFDNISNFDLSRKRNIFEFSTSENYKLVKLALININLLKFEFNNVFYLIETERNITADIIIQELLNNEIKINYFRDISKSTKKLMY